MTTASDLCEARQDSGRYGDPDFDLVRSKFYEMAERQFANCPLTPSVKPKGKGKKKQPAPEPVVIDGKPVEREKYGNPALNCERDNASDAMQWLVYRGHLNSRIEGDRNDAKLEIAWSEGNGRRTTADRLETMFQKATLTPLRSPDLEAIPGGFGPRAVSTSKVTNMMMVQDVRNEMPPVLMKLLERILIGNEHVWHGLGKKRQAAVFEEIRLALDFAAWVLTKIDAGAAGHAQVEKERQKLCQRWEWASEYFYQKQLGAAVSAARVIKRKA